MCVRCLKYRKIITKHFNLDLKSRSLNISVAQRLIVGGTKNLKITPFQIFFLKLERLPFETFNYPTHLFFNGLYSHLNPFTADVAKRRLPGRPRIITFF